MGVVIIGAGGHAKVAIDAAVLQGLSIQHVEDNDVTLLGKRILGHSIQSQSSMPDPAHHYLVAIGNNQVRFDLSQQLSASRAQFVTVIHPRAVVAESATIGGGSVVFAQAVLNPCASVGQHCIVNTGAIIEHDCELANYVQVCPNVTLAGAVKVGQGAFIATGVTVIPGITIGEGSFIAAGAVVTKDVPAGKLVAGCPARVCKPYLEFRRKS